MATIWYDVRHAARSLCRSPAFTTVAVLVLALGIGATSATFSLVDATLLRPLPFSDADRLVMLRERPPGAEATRVAPLNFLDWSEQSHVFQSMAAVAGAGRVLTGLTAAAERVPSQSVTTAFFDVFGVTPVAGRTFVAADARAHVIVISERFWRSRLGADPSAVGRVLRLDGEPYTVIGIVPASFQVLGESELWAPLAFRQSPEQRRIHYLQVVARLEPGATIDQARSGMAVVAGNIARLSPETNKDWTVAVEPLRQAIVGGELRTTTLVLGGVVAFVLLMSCANVANLLLARGISRARELAVRRAIGGSAFQILRLLVSESVLVASIGGIAGILISWIMIRTAPALLPAGLLPPGIELQFDARIVAFASAVIGIAGLLVGAAPAWHSAHRPLASALAAGTRASASGGALRSALAIAEVAAAVLLLAGAGLLVRTLAAMSSEDHGFRADSVLTMSVNLPFNRYRTPEELLRFYRQAEAALAALPGVRAVGFGNNLPLQGWDMGQPVEIVGDAPIDPANRPAAHYEMVSPGYFAALGIAFLKGRAFTVHDVAGSQPVAIVNEPFVRRHLRGREPIGALVKVPNVAWGASAPVVREIVGVIRQVASQPGEVEKPAEIYVPLEQNAWYSTAIALKTGADPLGIADDARAAIARIDPDLPVTRVRTMEQAAADSVTKPRFRAAAVSVCAAVALALASVGVFGVLMFAVRQRAREFGIRMALGARAADILALVLRGGARIAGAGLAIGLALAAVLTRWLESLLYGVAPLDPLTYAATTAVLAATVLLACVTPALLAVRTDPAIALRGE